MFNQISGLPVTQSSWHTELPIVLFHTTSLQLLPHYSAPLYSKTHAALPHLPFALDLTQWVLISTLSHPNKCHPCLRLAQAKLCLPYRLLPGLTVCLCEFLNSSASPAGQNRFQGSSCQLTTYLSPLLQIKDLLGSPVDVPCTLKKYVWLYSREICHWEHLSLHHPSPCLSFIALTATLSASWFKVTDVSWFHQRWSFHFFQHSLCYLKGNLQEEKKRSNRSLYRSKTGNYKVCDY